MTEPLKPGREACLTELQHAAKLWCYTVVLLALARGGMILAMSERITTTSVWGDVARVMAKGSQFDSTIAFWVAFVPGVLGLCCGRWEWGRWARLSRRICGIGVAVLTPLLMVLSIGYFKEYDDQFNHFIFGLYYDDTEAILSTLWTRYHPLRTLAAGVGLAVLTVPGFLLWMRERWVIRTRQLSPRLQAVCIALILVVGIVSARGSWGRRPIQKKDAGVTADEFLNKCVVNPYTALRYAVKDQAKLSGGAGLDMFIGDGDIAAALERVTGRSQAECSTVDDFLRREAAGPPNEVPDHVFLIVMETYEAWPLFPDFESMGLTPELAALAKKGTYVHGFLPSSGGTIESLSCIITGLPDAGVHTNFQRTARTPYATSIAESFKRLGYTTRAFYGGYLSWQSYGDFCSNQGFDEVYGGGHMGKHERSNEWGVDDEVLFDFVAETVTPSTKSFNLIMTTSFHPPYDIDVKAKGFVEPTVSETLAERCGTDLDMAMLGHFWYSDHCLGEFVRRVEPMLPKMVMAITGDHAGRRQISHQPTVAERSLVPCVIYGPTILARDERALTGSHIDLGPTLFELVAPEGTQYYALGRNMLSATPPALAAGRGHVVGPAMVWKTRQANSSETPLPWGGAVDTIPETAKLLRFHNDLHGIAWWRIMQGNALPSAQN